MENEKVVEIAKRIEADFRELQKVTGENYLSGCLIDNAFMLTSQRNENGQLKVDFYRLEG